MPRYFLHLRDGGFEPDREGTEFPNLRAAKAEAVRFAADMLRDHPDYVWEGHDLRVEVANEAGDLLCTVVIRGIDAASARQTH